MILDRAALFTGNIIEGLSDGTPLSVAGSATTYTNALDVGGPSGPAAGYISGSGLGTPTKAVVKVVSAITTASKLQVSVQTSPDDATWSTVLTSASLPVPASGGFFPQALPMPATLQRYVRLALTFDTAPGAGSIVAGLVVDSEALPGQVPAVFPSAFSY